MKKFIFTVILFVFGVSMTQAQDMGSLSSAPSSYYSFSWNIVFPMGDFNKWVSKAGLEGFDFGGQYYIKNGLAAGFDIAWARVYQDYNNQTYTIPDKGIAITADNYRFTWMVPFQAVIAYHINPDKMFSPYIGLGIGGDYMEHHLLVQEYDIYEDQWDFSLTPEIGAIVKFGQTTNWGGLVAFNYKWTTNKIDIYHDKTSDLSMLDLKIGLVYLVP
jgi:opacity protein-like surface antigen